MSAGGRVDTRSKETRSITKSCRGNIEILLVSNDIPNILIRLRGRGRRIRKPSLFYQSPWNKKEVDTSLIVKVISPSLGMSENTCAGVEPLAA